MCSKDNTFSLTKLFTSPKNAHDYCAKTAVGCIQIAKKASKTVKFKMGNVIPIYLSIADKPISSRQFSEQISTFPTAQFFPDVAAETWLNLLNANEIINDTRYKLTACCLCKKGLVCTKKELDWIASTEKLMLKEAILNIRLVKGSIADVRWSGPRCKSDKSCINEIAAIQYKNLAKTKISIVMQWQGTDADGKSIAKLL